MLASKCALPKWNWLMHLGVQQSPRSVTRKSNYYHVSMVQCLHCLNTPVSSGFLDLEGHATQHIYYDKV